MYLHLILGPQSKHFLYYSLINIRIFAFWVLNQLAVVTTANWSDFVFDDDYELKKLEEVLENGVSLAEMDAVLLQKIEELTLYLIELKKENEEMKGKIDVLENK